MAFILLGKKGCGEAATIYHDQPGALLCLTSRHRKQHTNRSVAAIIPQLRRP
jgi:hypothetical protein